MSHTLSELRKKSGCPMNNHVAISGCLLKLLDARNMPQFEINYLVSNKVELVYRSLVKKNFSNMLTILSAMSGLIKCTCLKIDFLVVSLTTSALCFGCPRWMENHKFQTLISMYTSKWLEHYLMEYLEIQTSKCLNYHKHCLHQIINPVGTLSISIYIIQKNKIFTTGYKPSDRIWDINT